MGKPVWRKCDSQHAAGWRFASLILSLVMGVSCLLAGLVIPASAADDVDVALVLAVDVSYSMDQEEQTLQRGGYVSALLSNEVLQAIRDGARGRIAITYVEWAGATDQAVIVPWRIIDGQASAKAFTEELLAKPYRRASRTSIAGALLFSAPLFEQSGISAARRVIDVSGDGPNNAGIPVTEARADVLSRGIVINGLPLMLKRDRSYMDIEALDAYYENCVIGGDSSFVVPIRSRENFNTATRMKLLLEIAGLSLPPRIIPAAQQLADCRVGEKMWQQRMDWMKN